MTFVLLLVVETKVAPLKVGNLMVNLCLSATAFWPTAKSLEEGPGSSGPFFMPGIRAQGAKIWGDRCWTGSSGFFKAS